MPKEVKISQKEKAPIKQRNYRLMTIMHNLAYLCVGLALVLSVTQFWLYGLRYRRIYNPNVWSYITLTNGQSYFGHLEQYGPHTVVLFNVYYLQSVPATDTADNENNTESVNTSAETADTTTEDNKNDSNLQLMNVGDDLHKPYDYLIINRDQILFWQQLTNESPIVQSLEGENKTN